MKKAAALLVLVLASVALVACGSSSDDTTETSAPTTSESAGGSGGGGGGENGNEGGGTASVLKFEAAPGTALAYTSKDVSAKAGETTVEFNNPQALDHDVAIEDSSGKEVGVTELVSKGTATTTVDLKPGTYTYFCTVPGHREAGMEGTLTVK